MGILMKRFCIALMGVFSVLTVVAEMKIGIIGLDTSHSICFTEILNVKTNPAFAGFRITAAYQWGSKDIFTSTNRYPKYIAQMKEMGVEIVPTIDDLLKKVDAVCLETNDGREHYWQAEKVFQSGKRVFIDKPIAHNFEDARRIYELGKKYNAQYFSASSLRYSKVAQAARNGKYGKIWGASLTSPAPIEKQGTHGFYTWYGIHGFEPLVTVMGPGIEKVSCFRNDGGDVINALWKDGRMGQLRLMRSQWLYSGYVMPLNAAVVAFDGYPGYEPLVAEIISFFKTGVVPVSPEETLELFAFMEAAERSAKAGGAPVSLSEIMK